MKKGVAITGMGIISSIGNNVKENYRSLTNSRPGISFPQILKTHHANLPVGEIKITNETLAEILELPQGHSYTRTALLGVLAAKEAIKQSDLREEQLSNTGFISGTSVGGMDMTENYFREFQDSTENRRFIRAQHPGFTTGKITEYFKLNGFTSTISTACSSSATAIMLGARMIKAGKLKRVIVGGTDCLTRFTLNGFNSLMILSSENCKPFDNTRSGLNLGEGAAYLVLEAEDVLDGKKVLGRISGYGNANDAFHQTASSKEGEGAFLAIQKAMDIAGLFPDNIDHINAHGTATLNNDLSESRAILRVFGEKVPPLTSTKAFTGHTLAAAGAIEAVYSLLAVRNDEMFTTLNFQKAMEETGIIPVIQPEKKELRNVLSNS
ncbi:MAG TPA: beta-ketoacyl-[acyl-carrier-protein] synthase family protein, partial [Gillisia sp.]|nr:beta-ketoacyl-[acyl-carrier-protein] synthase family protein [Gillisia sp.]